VVDSTDADDLARRRAELERRVDAGEWLRISELAELFGKHRGTVHRWVTKYGLIAHRPSSPAGGRAALECDPVDVRAQLAKLRQVRRGPTHG